MHDFRNFLDPGRLDRAGLTWHGIGRTPVPAG